MTNIREVIRRLVKYLVLVLVIAFVTFSLLISQVFVPSRMKSIQGFCTVKALVGIAYVVGLDVGFGVAVCCGGLSGLFNVSGRGKCVCAMSVLLFLSTSIALQ